MANGRIYVVLALLTSVRDIHFARHLVETGATPRVDAFTIACPRWLQFSQIVYDPLLSLVDIYI